MFAAFSAADRHQPVADLHRKLVTLLAERSARRGQFVLSSGRISNLYIDTRLTTMSPEGLSIIGALALPTMIREFGEVDSVGGLTLGADPIAYAIAYASASSGWLVRAFTVRKEAKTHGTGRLIEGPYHPGDRVVVIEDVITTGSSALKAVDALKVHGAQILGVLALVDREEGGCEALEGVGLHVYSLTKSSQIFPLVEPAL